MKQVRFLLKFCHEDALCYLYDKTEEIWSFPYFALWKNDTAPQFLEKSLMKYQRNGRAEAYRISCPLLSRKMLSEFSVRIICRFHADRKKYCGGQEGFFVEMNGCAILTQGLVGHDTELQIRFYRNRVLSEEQFEDVIQAAFEEWERCVSKLPEYLKRKFDILVDRFSSGRTDIRFREKESISIQNLNGYVNAGRDEYFSGILNRQFSLDSFFFPRSLESAGEAEDGINNV